MIGNGQKTKEIEIPQMPIRTIDVPIVGTSLLCQHRWSEKAKKQIKDKQTGEATGGQDAKDPVLNARSSLHLYDESKRDEWNEGEIDKSDLFFAVPSIAFKKAMVRGSKQTDYMSMTDARGAFFVKGRGGRDKIKVMEPGFSDLSNVEESADPLMREDMVRVGRGKSDIRFRGYFPQWACELRIEFNSNTITAPQIVQIVQLAGYGCGVGEYRPENDGQWGRFSPVMDETRKEVEKAVQQETPEPEPA